MWISPKQTILTIVEENPSRGVYLLATFLALENFFFYANMWSLGLNAHFLALVVIGIAISPFLGYFWILIMGHVFYYTGRWMKGAAPVEHLRAAVAWSKIPAIGILLSWMCILAIAPEEAFIYSGGGNPYVLIFNVLNLIFAIWSIWILFEAIREVQQFSVGRTIANILLSWCLFSLPLTIVIFIVLFLLKF